MIDAEQLKGSVCGVEQRPEEIHHCSYAELPAHPCNMLHRSVIEGREEKGEPRLLQELSGIIGPQVDRDAEPFVEVGTSRTGADAPVSMLCHPHTAGCDDECSHG